jgi:hypothetical protein
MSTYLKRVKHAISPDDRFNGYEPIEILAFLRIFKEAADHIELSEAAEARLIPYFLTGAAKEGYSAHLDEARKKTTPSDRPASSLTSRKRVRKGIISSPSLPVNDFVILGPTRQLFF